MLFAVLRPTKRYVGFSSEGK